jgi:hypothetical protein
LLTLRTSFPPLDNALGLPSCRIFSYGELV